MKVPFKLFLASIAFASFASCSKDSRYLQNQSENQSLQTKENRSGQNPEAIVIKAAGDIIPALTEFQNLLGTLNSHPGRAWPQGSKLGCRAYRIYQ